MSVDNLEAHKVLYYDDLEVNNVGEFIKGLHSTIPTGVKWGVDNVVMSGGRAYLSIGFISQPHQGWVPFLANMVGLNRVLGLKGQLGFLHPYNRDCSLMVIDNGERQLEWVRYNGKVDRVVSKGELQNLVVDAMKDLGVTTLKDLMRVGGYK